MPLIAIASPKGGVGKTTLTAHLAAILAGRGYRVTVLDLDPQNALRLHMGVSICEESGFMASIQASDVWKSALLDTDCGAKLLPFGAAEPADVLDIATALATRPELLAGRCGTCWPTPNWCFWSTRRPARAARRRRCTR